LIGRSCFFVVLKVWIYDVLSIALIFLPLISFPILLEISAPLSTFLHCLSDSTILITVVFGRLVLYDFALALQIVSE
jgi:hypothetical protein